MKQILLLLLFPCFAMAQYTGNANQKITLGEQTTADGLVYRGVASADTIRKPSIDTMAFILLDTTTNILWQYKKATNNAWTRLGGSISSGVTGVLPVANGGTGQSTLTANKVMVGNGTSGVLSPTNLHWDNVNSRLGIGTATPFSKLRLKANIDDFTGGISFQRSGTLDTWANAIGSDNNLYYGYANAISGADNSLDFESIFEINTNGYGSFSDGDQGFIIGAYTGNAGYGAIYPTTVIPGAGNYVLAATLNQTILNCGDNIDLSIGGSPAMSIINNGNVGIGTTSPESGYRLHVVDSVYVGGNVSASAYTTRSDYELKDEIQNISYGINEVMQMQPVKYTYKSNGSTQLGFIAQDLGVITPEVVSFEDKMSVYYNALIPILTKAIQEQQALIKALEQRILTLENK